MSRAARTIPSILVEGCGKNSQAELGRYSDMASGSCSELEYWVLTARDIGYFGVQAGACRESSPLSQIRRPPDSTHVLSSKNRAPRE
jgi:four helix bundle protein